MLKNNKQRGTGLRLVRTAEAFRACFETTTRPGLEGMVLYRWYLAQQYIPNPLLLKGCKSGLRLWVLVPGVQPLRAYVHQRGLVLFSSSMYDLAGEDWGRDLRWWATMLFSSSEYGLAGRGQGRQRRGEGTVEVVESGVEKGRCYLPIPLFCTILLAVQDMSGQVRNRWEGLGLGG